MGEAKKRGTYSQRKAEGEARKEALKLERERIATEKCAAYEAVLTPDQKRQRERSRELLAILASLSLGVRP